MKILVTGGTVFVSRYAAEYYAAQGHDVYVLNRNTKPQPDSVTLIEADRHALGDALRGRHFDVVLDMNSYDAKDAADLIDALESFDDYIFISSSAVYPETEAQPFNEETHIGENRIWGAYGFNKIAAEQLIGSRVPQAYILRPPYLYGPWNNVYREAFVFDCAMQDRTFLLPKDGSLPLQFFHIRDLCRFIDVLLAQHPQQRVFNVGNPEAVSAREWVELCYAAAGKTAQCEEVHAEIDQRSYFSFYDYAYMLDVQRQMQLLQELTPLAEGLQESFAWYVSHTDAVKKKPFLDYIDQNLRNAD